jgi:hypothetical protein
MGPYSSMSISLLGEVLVVPIVLLLLKFEIVARSVTTIYYRDGVNQFSAYALIYQPSILLLLFFFFVGSLLLTYPSPTSCSRPFLPLYLSTQV